MSKTEAQVRRAILDKLYDNHQNHPTASVGWFISQQPAEERIFWQRVPRDLADEGLISCNFGAQGDVYNAKLTSLGAASMKQPRVISSGAVQVYSLRALFDRLRDEWVIRAGDDGNLYLSDRATPQILEARIYLDGDEPRCENLTNTPDILSRRVARAFLQVRHRRVAAADTRGERLCLRAPAPRAQGESTVRSTRSVVGQAACRQPQTAPAGPDSSTLHSYAGFAQLRAVAVEGSNVRVTKAQRQTPARDRRA